MVKYVITIGRAMRRGGGARREAAALTKRRSMKMGKICENIDMNKIIQSLHSAVIRAMPGFMEDRINTLYEKYRNCSPSTLKRLITYYMNKRRRLQSQCTREELELMAHLPGSIFDDIDDILYVLYQLLERHKNRKEARAS